VAAQSAQAYLQQVYQNTLSLLVLVDVVIAYPTQANIDAVVNSFGSTLVQMRPSYSLDSESYDWPGYRKMLVDSLLPIEQAIQRAGGPYLLKQRAVLGPGLSSSSGSGTW